MKLFPAIDIIDGCAVRLVKGDYDQKTVYSESPLEVAKGFAAEGAEYLHIVDLDGARTGTAPNLEVIKDIVEKSGLRVEVGGGIRNAMTAEKYLNIGVFRIILGTAAVTDPVFLEKMIKKYGERIAVGVDIKDGMVAIKGWRELSREKCLDFCRKMEEKGVKIIICTDISKDGLLSGTNLELYKKMSEELSVDIVASGGITALEDIARLAEMDIYGAILGKALYEGRLSLKAAVEMTRRAKK